MNEVDISIFQFDYDLTWMGFFLDGNNRVYARYGGRDPASSDARLSVEGLKYTLRHVLDLHGKRPADTPAPFHRPVIAQDVLKSRNRCLHCHEVWEGLRRQEKAAGKFDPESLFVYPIPENVGLKLDINAGNKVLSVTPTSPSQKADIQAGDVIEAIDKVKTFSQADVMWALHNAPVEGKVSIQYRRSDQVHTATLELTRGWKKTDLRWRTSMRMEKRSKE